MSLVPSFESGLWNAWLPMVLSLLVTYGLSYLVVDRRSALFASPEYTATEKRAIPITMVLLTVLIMYSIFLPLKLGTMWFYVGLAAYALGVLLPVLATFGFANTPPGEPVTRGIFRFSRHPMYLGYLFTFVGIGLAAASWLFGVVALAISILQNYFWIPPEERMCLDKFGESYQAYMDKTPKWIGLPKS